MEVSRSRNGSRKTVGIRASRGAVGNENFGVILDLNGTNGLVTRRLYGDGQDDIIAKQSSVGVVTWYLTDRLGSVQSLVDNSGLSVGTLAYSAFGSTTVNTGVPDRYQYTGREWDARWDCNTTATGCTYRAAAAG